MINKASLINIQALTEENNFNLTFAEQTSVLKPGKYYFKGN